MEKSKKTRLAIICAIIAVAVAAIVAIVLIFCTNKNKLIGRWKSEYGSWYYSFDTDSEGSYGIEEFDIPAQKFTYKDNGDSFSIQFENTTSEVTLQYRFEDDYKKLIVVDSLGLDTTYLRQ